MTKVHSIQVMGSYFSPIDTLRILLLSFLILSSLLAFTYAETYTSYPFNDIAVTQPTRSDPRIVFRGIISNPHRLGQMNQWRMDINFVLNEAVIDTQISPLDGKMFSQLKVWLYDIPEIKYQPSLEPIGGPFLLYPSEQQQPSMMSGHAKFHACMKLTEEESFRAIDDGPEFIIVVVEIPLTSDFFDGLNLDNYRGVLGSFQIEISSDIPDDKGQRISSFGHLYSLLTTFVDISHYPLVELITAGGGDDLSLVVDLNYDSIPHKIVDSSQQYRQINLARLPRTESLLPPGRYYELLTNYTTSPDFSTLSLWSIAIPWSQTLGGGNNQTTGSRLGFERPDYLEIRPHGPIGFAVNTTINTVPSTPKSIRCYLNSYPIDVIWTKDESTFSPSHGQPTLSSAIPYLRAELTDEIWSKLFFLSPFVDGEFKNGENISTYHNDTQSIQRGYDDGYRYPKDNDQEKHPDYNYTNHHDIDIDIDTWDKNNDNIGGQVNSNNQTFTPPTRFGTFTFDCRDQIIMTTPVLQNITGWEGMGVSQGLTANLVRQHPPTPSSHQFPEPKPLVSKTMIRYDIIPDVYQGIDFQDIRILPYFLGLDQSTPTPTPILFNLSSTNHDLPNIPPFIIPLAPPIITSINDVSTVQTPYISTRIILNLLLDLNYFVNPFKTRSLPELDSPFFILNLTPSDQYKTLPDQRISILYQRVGQSKGDDSSPSHFEAHTRWGTGENVLSTAPFPLPPLPPTQESLYNSFPFNNIHHQYYSMTLMLEVMIPHLFLPQHSQILFTNQVQLSFYPRPASIPWIHYQYVPVENWLLNIYNHGALQSPPLSQSTQTQGLSQEPRRTNHMPSDRLVDSFGNQKISTLNDNRITALNYTPTYWDMKTLSTHSINLLFTQNITGSHIPQQISTITIHLVGSYLFATPKLAEFPFDDHDHDCDHDCTTAPDNNEGDDNHHDIPSFLPFIMSPFDSPSTIELTCGVIDRGPCKAEADDIILSDKILSIKINYTHDGPLQSLQFLQIKIPVSTLFIMPIAHTSKHHARSQKFNDIFPEIGFVTPTNTIALVAHVGFTNQRVYDFGVSFYSNQSIGQIPSAFGFPPSDDQTPGDTGLPQIVWIGIYISLGFVMSIALGTALFLLSCFTWGNGEQDNTSPADDLTHHGLNGQIIGVIDGGDERTLELLQSQVESRVQDVMSNFVDGIVKSLDDYQPPTYGDIQHNSVGDNQLPEYDDSEPHNVTCPTSSKTPTSTQGGTTPTTHDLQQPLSYEFIHMIGSRDSMQLDDHTTANANHNKSHLPTTIRTMTSSPPPTPIDSLNTSTATTDTTTTTTTTTTFPRMAPAP